jgi:hypothetical protein
MAKFQEPGHYTDKDRERIPDESFGDPAGKRFPIVVAKDVADASHLLGKVADPAERARIKARIAVIAKKRGFPLPESWDEDEGARALEAEVIRDAGEASERRVTLPAEIRVVDQERREIEICATSEARDSYKTIFGYDASKDAFQRWLGNIREMHAPKAVGRKVDVRFDDAARKIYVQARISKGAQDTWEKIMDGTLQGASIGASNVKWQTEVIQGEPTPIAKRYDLVELSLVDSPSNPDALGISFIRSAEADPDNILEAVPMEADENRTDNIPDVPTEPVTPTNPAAAAFAAVAQEVRASRKPGGTPQSGWIERQQRGAERAAREDEVRAAGEAAVAALGGLSLGEDYGSYAARVAQVRGTAEQRVLLAQKARKSAPAAEEAPAAVERASDNAAVIETGAGVSSDATDAHSGQVLTGDPVGAQASLHDDSDAPAVAMSGQDTLHDEEHTHADGTTHRHPHVHTGSHAVHQHGHAFRNGVATDIRVLQAEVQAATQADATQADATRAPAATKAPAYSSGGLADGVSAQAKAHPVSGSAQPDGPAESGLEKMTPDKVGHPVAYNPETVNKLPFGVPATAASIPASPDLAPGDLALDPSLQHDLAARPAAADGPQSGHTASSPVPGGTSVATAPEAMLRPTPGNPRAASRAAGEADESSADEAEDVPGDNGTGGQFDDDGDHDANEDMAELKENTGRTPAKATKAPAKAKAKRDGGEAEETRVGARISAESRGALHVARDSMKASLAQLCQHCGCPECQAHLDALAAASAPGEEALDEPERSQHAAVARFAERRVMTALVERAVEQVVERVVAAALARAVETLSTQLETRLASLATDLTLTLADTTQTTQTNYQEATRSQTPDVQSLEALIARTIQPSLQRVEAAVADAAGQGALVQVLQDVAERVKRIEAQPVSGFSGLGAGPVAGIADKQLALNPANASTSYHPQDEIARLTALARGTTDANVQTAVAAQIARIQNPNLR